MNLILNFTTTVPVGLNSVKHQGRMLSQRNRNVPILVALEMSATISLFLLLEPFSPWVIRGWAPWAFFGSLALANGRIGLRRSAT